MPLKICEVLAEAENTLRVAGIPEYKNDAWLLFEAVFQMNRTGYLMHMSEKLEGIPDAEMLYEKYREVTEKRSRHIPLQHITGHQVFMGLDFEVNENSDSKAGYGDISRRSIETVQGKYTDCTGA